MPRRKSTKKSRSRSKARSKTRRTKIIKGGKIDYAIDCFPNETDCEKNILEEEEHAALQQKYEDSGPFGIFTNNQGNSEILERQRRRNDVRKTNKIYKEQIQKMIDEQRRKNEQVLAEQKRKNEQVLAEQKRKNEQVLAEQKRKNEQILEDQKHKNDTLTAELSKATAQTQNNIIAQNKLIIDPIIDRYTKYIETHNDQKNNISPQGISNEDNDTKLQSLNTTINDLYKTCVSLITDITNNEGIINDARQRLNDLNENKQFYENSIVIIKMAINVSSKNKQYAKKVSVDDPNVFAAALNLKQAGYTNKATNVALRKATCDALVDSNIEFFIPQTQIYEQYDYKLSYPLKNTHLLKVMTTPYQCEPEYTQLRNKIDINQRELCIPTNKEDYKDNDRKESATCVDAIIKYGSPQTGGFLFQ